MMFHSASLTAAILGLAVVSSARAADDKKDDAKPGMDKPITVRGVISDFTMLGEADVDETTGKATTAEATLVTIIGHPTGMESDQAHRAAMEKSAGKDHPQHHHHRMNLYIAALTPKTKVSEVNGAGKEVAADDKDADFDDLEIGDRVEVTFVPKMMDKDDDKPGDDKDKKAASKHGRHRTYLGMAMQIKLMADETAADSKGSK